MCPSYPASLTLYSYLSRESVIQLNDRVIDHHRDGLLLGILPAAGPTGSSGVETSFSIYLDLGLFWFFVDLEDGLLLIT